VDVVVALSTFFAAIAAVASLRAVGLARKTRQDANAHHRQQVRMRRLEQLDRIADLVVRWGEIAREEGGAPREASRLPVIRQRLDVALGIFSNLGGPTLTKCEEVADLSASRSPAFPTLAQTESLVHEAMNELAAALEDDAL
jgi:hypothetical protein